MSNHPRNTDPVKSNPWQAYTMSQASIKKGGGRRSFEEVTAQLNSEEEVGVQGSEMRRGILSKAL